MERREFIKSAVWKAGGILLLPFAFESALLAGTETLSVVDPISKRKKVFILIIQRGAMDGLALLAPAGDPLYQELRPNIGLKLGQGNDSPFNLGGTFALHPAMSSLFPYWKDKTLAFFHQIGSPDPTRSHFDAQDYLETGTPGKKNTTDGFLNRALQALDHSNTGSLQGVAMEPGMPRALQGKNRALSMTSLSDFNLKSGEGFESMYSEAADQLFRGAGKEAFESLKSVDHLLKGKPAPDDLYPKTQIAKRLRDLATLIKSDVGVKIAVTDVGGWDTHVYQGNAHGQLSDRLKELSEALSSFAKDLGPRFSDVCVACVTEFGRTVKENGTRGTDHGHGSVMTLLGGEIRGGKVYGEWSGLKKENLFEERDLPVTTDYRDVFSEIFEKHLSIQKLDRIFPGFSRPLARDGGFGLFKT